MTTGEAHFLHSSRREKILENVFIGEVLKELWRRGVYEAELLQSDIDAAGYDIVLETPSGVRHIQLKSSISDKGWWLSANGKISDKSAGCLIKMIVNSDTLAFESFYWLGNAIGEQAPDIRTGTRQKHTKSNSLGNKTLRSDTYKIRKSQCEKVASISGLVDKLVEKKP